MGSVRLDLSLVQQLRRYFERHPRARDTAEGIARFWVDATVGEVLRALEFLREAGDVREVGVVGARHWEWTRRPGGNESGRGAKEEDA